jgi:hypothetical protein
VASHGQARNVQNGRRRAKIVNQVRAFDSETHALPLLPVLSGEHQLFDIPAGCAYVHIVPVWQLKGMKRILEAPLSPVKESSLPAPYEPQDRITAR